MRILILRLSSLGDIVLTQPVTAVLRTQYPDAQIDYLTRSPFIPIVKAFGTINTVYDERQLNEILPRLVSQEYDWVIDLHAKVSTWKIAKEIKPKNKSVYKKQHLLRQLIVWHLTKRSIRSTVDLYMTALKPILSQTSYHYPSLQETSQAMPSWFIEMEQSHRQWITLFPGAAHPTKRYPLELWKEVVAGISEEVGVLLLGSPDECDLCTELAQSAPRFVYNHCGELNTKELLIAIQHSNIVITNDSGPMHLAAAYQKPQIAIFGSTHTRLGFAPLNHVAIIFEKNLRCQPCTLHGRDHCPKEHFNCMRKISPAQINQAIQAMLVDE